MLSVKLIRCSWPKIVLGYILRASRACMYVMPVIIYLNFVFHVSHGHFFTHMFMYACNIQQKKSMLGYYFEQSFQAPIVRYFFENSILANINPT